MSEKLRWGILGCGNVTQNLFLPGLVNSPSSELYAVAGRTPEKREAVMKFQPKAVYDDYEKLINDPNVDAVYIGLPNTMHCEWAIRAMNAKRHVLCEKPMAMSEAEAKQMFAAAQANGVILEEAFAYLHGSVVEKAREILDSGIIGDIRHIDVRFHDLLKNRGDLRFNPNMGGGVVYDMGCYALSFIRHFLGREPKRIDSILNIGVQSRVDESALLSLAFEDSAVTAGAYVSLNSRTDCTRTIVGETGVIIIPLFFNVIGEKSIMLKKPKGVEKIPLTCRDPYQAEAEQFAACVLRGEKPLISPEFSIGNAAAIEASLINR